MLSTSFSTIQGGKTFVIHPTGRTVCYCGVSAQEFDMHEQGDEVTYQCPSFFAPTRATRYEVIAQAFDKDASDDRDFY